MKTETFSFSEMLLEFVEELRKNSVPIGTDNYLTYLQAISHLNPANLVDLYWGGRTTLINRHDWEKVDRKSTRLNSSHSQQSRMPSSA
mgnify:CR=1 FL=1